MKKIISLFLAVLMTMSLTACSSGTGGTSAVPDAAAGADATAGPEVKIQSVGDLEGKKIGVQLGTTGDIYAEDIPGVTLEQFKTGAEAVLALKQGKVDAVIIDDQPAKAYAERNEEITVLDEPFTIEDYAICIKKESELTELFNGAIAELKADGTLQGIIDYYIGQQDGAAPYSSPEGVEYPNGTLVMATNAAFPPYEYWENERICGLDADFAQAICDRLGYELKIEDMDFDAIIVAVQSGKADFGAAGMTVTEDRLKNIDFTDSYYTGSQVVIIMK